MEAAEGRHGRVRGQTFGQTLICPDAGMSSPVEGERRPVQQQGLRMHLGRILLRPSYYVHMGVTIETPLAGPTGRPCARAHPRLRHAAQGKSQGEYGKRDSAPILCASRAGCTPCMVPVSPTPKPIQVSCHAVPCRALRQGLFIRNGAAHARALHSSPTPPDRMHPVHCSPQTHRPMRELNAAPGAQPTARGSEETRWG